jgi:WD40 repeat protein
VPYVTDFGLAKRLDPGRSAPAPEGAEADAAGDVSASGLVGTVSYMAPEQAAGRRGLTVAVDVYALGAILYEVLTGRPPFPLAPPQDLAETLRQVIAEEPEPPRRREPRVPADLEAVCLKCLQKDPRRRYASAEALAQDLERFLEGRPTRVRPGPPWERALKWARRQPALAGLAAVVALTLLGLVAGGLWHHAQLRDALEQTRERELTGRRYLYAAQMSLALQEWKRGHDALALDLLERHRPRRGEEDLRGFEWYYLWRLCHGGSTLTGHDGPVYAAAFAPDGRTLATAAGDTTVRLWGPATGEVKGILRGHTGAVVAVAFAAGGRTLATAGEDKTVRLWDADTFQPLAVAEVPLPVSCLALAPDGKTLASGGDDRKLRLWDVAEGSLRPLGAFEAHKEALRCVAYAPDGRTLATGSLDTTVKLWRVEKDGVREVRQLSGHTDELSAVAFSPDGKRLASGSTDDPVFVWDVASGQRLATLDGSRLDFLSVAYAPDGKTLATGGRNGLVRLWDAETCQPRGRLEGHTGPVYALAFSPDSRTLATGANDGTVKLWDLSRPDRALAPREGFQKVVLAGTGRTTAAFSPDGRLVVTASKGADGKGEVKLWDTEGHALAALPDAPDAPTCVALSPDGKMVAAGDRDGAVKVWDVVESGGRWRGTARWAGTHTERVLAVAFSPDGRTLASGGVDETAKLWDAGTGAERARLRGHAGAVAAVAFSPDGAVLASGGRDRTVRLWRVAGGQELPPLQGAGHLDWVTGLAFDPVGKTLATGSDDGTIKLWDLARGRLTATLEGHAGWIGPVAFSPDGKTLVTGSDDLTVKLWDRASGLVRASLEGHTGMVRAVAFRADGQTLLTAGEDRLVLLWQAATAQEVGE